MKKASPCRGGGTGSACLSLWERWLSGAKTERANAAGDCKALSVSCADSSPGGRAKAAVGAGQDKGGLTNAGGLV